MKILITGGKGFLGQALKAVCEKNGDSVSILTRTVTSQSAQEILWKPEQGRLDSGLLEGFDAIVHLAGDSIADGRWTQDKKNRIRESRIHGTRLLSQTISRMASPPKVFLTASAIGYYGDRKDESLSEESLKGIGFLSDVCAEWESATESAQKSGIRVAHARIGIVLGRNGGALQKMLLPFKLGLGGRLGSGQQYMSWVSLADVAKSMAFAFKNASIRGAFNVTSPNPVPNSEFTRVVGRVLNRPTLFPAPTFALKLILGEMADALLLSSARVYPNKLQKAGYQFIHADLESALRSAIES